LLTYCDALACPLRKLGTQKNTAALVHRWHIGPNSFEVGEPAEVGMNPKLCEAGLSISN